LRPIPVTGFLVLKKLAIRDFFSATLLAVCFLSFLPKSLFHDVVATHVDAESCSHPLKKKDCIHAQGFNCGFTDLVVNSPYDHPVHEFLIAAPHFFTGFISTYSSAFLHNAFLATESRGPPVAA
jgi:hypothetical protein